MGQITIWLGVAAALVLAFTLLPRHRADHDDAAAAYALTMVWIAGAGARSIFGDWRLGDDLAYLYVGPVSDVLFLTCIVYLARWNDARWLRILIGLAAFQLLAHVGYGLGDKSQELRDTYKLTLNVSYVAELACAAAPGGLHGVRHLFSRLRDRRPAPDQGAAR